MGEVEKILKTVDMDGEQVEIWMTKMMDPCTAEEFEAMSLEEREHAKIQPALNQRTYSPEDGIICMQDVPVKMRDGVTIYADIYKPEAEGKYPLIISWSFYGKRPFEGQAEWQIMGVPPHTAMRSPMWIREESDIPRAISFSSEHRTEKTDMILSNGQPSRIGVTDAAVWQETAA